MGIVEGVLGAFALGKTVIDVFTPEEEIDVPAVKPVDLEDAPELDLGIDTFEGLTTEERRAKKRLRTDIIDFKNTSFTTDNLIPDKGV